MSAEGAPSNVRKSFVAGAFYPAQPGALKTAVEQYLAAAEAGAREAPVPKAIIAPHAGYVYSGPIAGSAYARVKAGAKHIRRVVLLGPSHRVPLRGLATSSASAYETPLGLVPMDREACAALRGLPCVQEFDMAHGPEHSLEVHLPFLQAILPQFTLVPIVVGDATPGEVASVLDALWGGPETLFVVSSDLSHYETYETAQRMDADTARAIVALAVDGVAEQGACGRRPIRGLLEVARRRGLRATAVDVRNSGDTAGTRDRVVGYGSFVFEESPSAVLSGKARATLLNVARDVIHKGAMGGIKSEPMVQIPNAGAELTATRAAFVTLTAHGRLRGCIGSLEARFPLIQDVARNAFRCAFRDPRFPPVGVAELGLLETKISVLSTPSEMRFGSEDELVRSLTPGEDGLILADGTQRGTFLPQVWESIRDPAEFVRRLKVKAGLPPQHWSPTVRVWRYGAESFGAPAHDAVN